MGPVLFFFASVSISHACYFLKRINKKKIFFFFNHFHKKTSASSKFFETIKEVGKKACIHFCENIVSKKNLPLLWNVLLYYSATFPGILTFHIDRILRKNLTVNDNLHTFLPFSTVFKKLFFEGQSDWKEFCWLYRAIVLWGQRGPIYTQQKITILYFCKRVVTIYDNKSLQAVKYQKVFFAVCLIPLF